MPVDPGEHVVRATAPGYLPWEQRVRAVAPSAAAPAPPPAEVRVPGLTVDPAATPAPRKHWTVQRIVGASLVGVGVGGSATALGLALAAKSRYDSAVRDLCESPTACTEDGVREQTSAIRMADQATVVLIASGAAAAIGVVLYLTSPSPRASAPRSLQVTPLAAPGFAGAVFGGRF
jgi:hypothetical protein